MKSGKISGSMVRMLSRRELLLLVGGASFASMAGVRRVNSADDLEKLVACVISPEQTAGPYFVDERLNRKDIRSDPKDKSIKKGVLLSLELNVFQVNDKECTPLKNAMVDIWHCDADGLYSDVDDFNADTRGQKFLRGYQMTDNDGKVEFTTIYPGFYSGRTVHIHHKIRTDPKSDRSYEHTSQLYFDDKTTKEVMTQKPYSESKRSRVSNKKDGIYRDGGDTLMLELTKKGKGYLGKFNIGIAI